MIEFITLDDQFKIPVQFEEKSIYLVINTQLFDRISTEKLHLYLRYYYKETGQPSHWKNEIVEITKNHYADGEYKIYFKSPIGQSPFYIQFILGNTELVVFNSNFFKCYEDQTIVSLAYNKLLLYKSFNHQTTCKKVFLYIETQIKMDTHQFSWKVVDSATRREKILAVGEDPLISSYCIYSEPHPNSKKLWITFMIHTTQASHYIVTADDTFLFLCFYIDEQGVFKWYNHRSMNMVRSEEGEVTVNHDNFTEHGTFDVFLKTNTDTLFLSRGTKGKHKKIKHNDIHRNSEFIIKSDDDHSETGPFIDYVNFFM